ncbi:MAG: DNA-directed RNA polymerase subunit beta [Chloroflexi bacterium]|nr:DNA-directed RNA polymerase subunit beta [Chloroflexota bacterium]MBT7082128.1 DNA-directed RNA polymerase subunit beta [Chloroflexota bacterium]
MDSYKWFQAEGLKELLSEISPIKDFTGTRLELTFLNPNDGPDKDIPRFTFLPPKHTEDECRDRDLTYSTPLHVTAWLLIKETGEWKEQDLFMGDFPKMTDNGTFIINGAERVVVSQLIRSPGVYLTVAEDMASGRDLCFAKLVPNRGAWLEFETSSKNVISVKVDRKRKIPITTLIRSLGYGTDQELEALFKGADTNPDHPYIKTTIEKEPLVRSQDEALIDFHRRLRPSDPSTLDNANSFIDSLFFDPRRYDLGKVGRYKMNKRLGINIPSETRTLTKEDLVAVAQYIVKVNNGAVKPDDIDHLGNRRVRTVGELVQNQLRVGFLRMERVVKERMSITELETVTPSDLINIRPVSVTLKEFFGSSQLSQFMDQTNPLAELTHKRRLSALGPGGLSRERAGFDVRDVHHSHYGRICPIETPEGPNIGLIGSLATYGRINEYGLIETPYRKVVSKVKNKQQNLVGRIVRNNISDNKDKMVVVAGTEITEQIAAKLVELPLKNIEIVPFVSSNIDYLSADQEEDLIIAQANAILDDNQHFTEERVEARSADNYFMELPEKMDYMDVSPKQIVSVAASLIPFLEHDDANRALMGSNMQRQAVPLLLPEAPLVATGMERQAALDSGQVLFAKNEGVVASVTATMIAIKRKDGELDYYPLRKFDRSNQGTCINQRPVVSKGDKVKLGQVLADSSSTDEGELALGHNVLCAFMSWEGYNYEDAIVLSESLVKDDKFTSIHIEKHEVEARSTKLGPEEITRDIPNIGEESLRDLDERGIIRLGAEVGPGDILVGKITPKGETELSAEEKLLRAIFGEKAREVKDTSLRVPHGEYGKVIDVKAFPQDGSGEQPPGVNQMVRVCVAQKRKVSAGDKLAGRHGNKGVIGRILPVEDMPFLPDGRPLEVVLNPIGIPSRMNLGQVLETHLGWAAHVLGFGAMSPIFDSGQDVEIEDDLGRAWIVENAGAVDYDGGPYDTQKVSDWLTERGFDYDAVFNDKVIGTANDACVRLWLHQLGVKKAATIDEKAVKKELDKLYDKSRLVPPTTGKTILYDGRTGEQFDQPITVGYIYLLKLIHLVEDKIHARATGPYSLITQQPLGGKAQFGGQRFGEMEVWALEAYGAAHNLQEMLTVKSDDVVGRVKAYEAILKGEDIIEPGVPESFKVLVSELRSLGLAVEVINEAEEKISLIEEGVEESSNAGI